MSDSAVIVLRQAIKDKKPVSLDPSDADISKANDLLIDSKPYSLNETTQFISKDNTNHTLRAIYQCWLHNESTHTDYLSDCEDKKIPVISFMERTDLLSFLNGSSETCEYLKIDQSLLKSKANDKSAASASTITDKAEEKKTGSKRKLIDEDPFLKEILSHERNIIDHNKALRGSKIVDFSSVARECEHKIIKASKSKSTTTPSSSSSRTIASTSRSKISSSSKSSSRNGSVKPKDPIIILSPSASALLTMSNVKYFLQEGKFQDSTQLPLSSTDMLQLNRLSKTFNKPMKFLVVNNVDKFFTKPEHWDRVVAVFTTGQEWQFKNYKWSIPNVLFQKIKGYYIGYHGDTIPRSVNGWNVQVIEIDRNQRFRDRQISEFFWESLEKFMAAKGYK